MLPSENEHVLCLVLDQSVLSTRIPRNSTIQQESILVFISMALTFSSMRHFTSKAVLISHHPSKFSSSCNANSSSTSSRKLSQMLILFFNVESHFLWSSCLPTLNHVWFGEKGQRVDKTMLRIDQIT